MRKLLLAAAVLLWAAPAQALTYVYEINATLQAGATDPANLDGASFYSLFTISPAVPLHHVNGPLCCDEGSTLFNAAHYFGATPSQLGTAQITNRPNAAADLTLLLQPSFSQHDNLQNDALDRTLLSVSSFEGILDFGILFDILETTSFAISGTFGKPTLINATMDNASLIVFNVRVGPQQGTEYFLRDFSITSTTIPIPAALPLFATALAGIGLLSWRRRRAQHLARQQRQPIG